MTEFSKRQVLLSAGYAVALAALLLLAPGPMTSAGAQTYGPQATTLSCAVSRNGSTVNLSCTASGFASGAVLSASIVSPSTGLGTVQANANGVASLNVALPSTLAPGTYTVQVSGTAANGQTVVTSTTITIPGDSQSAGTALPRTGTNTFPLVSAASALVAVGGFLLVVANKRRSRTLAGA